MPSPPVAPSPASSDEDGVSGFAVGSSTPMSQPSATASVGGACVGDFARGAASAPAGTPGGGSGSNGSLAGAVIASGVATGVAAAVAAADSAAPAAAANIAASAGRVVGTPSDGAPRSSRSRRSRRRRPRSPRSPRSRSAGSSVASRRDAASTWLHSSSKRASCERSTSSRIGPASSHAWRSSSMTSTGSRPLKRRSPNAFARIACVSCAAMCSGEPVACVAAGGFGSSSSARAISLSRRPRSAAGASSVPRTAAACARATWRVICSAACDSSRLSSSRTLARSAIARGTTSSPPASTAAISALISSLAARHVAELFPLLLLRLDLGERLAPSAGAGRSGGDGLRACDQRLLLDEVVGLLGVARVELWLAALEEPIARGAEPLPQLVTLLARQVTGVLPLRLQLLEPVGGRGPGGRRGELLGRGEQRFLRLRHALELLGIDGALALHAVVDRVADLLELIPQLLAAALRHRADLFPQRLQRAEPVVEVGNVLGGEQLLCGRDQRLGLRDVLEPLPGLGLAERARFDHELAARGGIAVRECGALLGGNLADVAEHLARLLEQTIDRAAVAALRELR